MIIKLNEWINVWMDVRGNDLLKRSKLTKLTPKESKSLIRPFNL